MRRHETRTGGPQHAPAALGIFGYAKIWKCHCHDCKVSTTCEICASDKMARGGLAFVRPSVVPKGGINVCEFILRASFTHCVNSARVHLRATPFSDGPNVLTSPSTPGISWQAKQLPSCLETMTSKPMVVFGFSSARDVLFAEISRAQSNNFFIK